MMLASLMVKMCLKRDVMWLCVMVKKMFTNQ